MILGYAYVMMSERTAELVHYVVRAVSEKFGISFGPAWTSLKPEHQLAFKEQLVEFMKEIRTDYTVADTNHEVLADHYIPALVHAIDEANKVIERLDLKRAEIKTKRERQLASKVIELVKVK